MDNAHASTMCNLYMTIIAYLVSCCRCLPACFFSCWSFTVEMAFFTAALRWRFAEVQLIWICGMIFHFQFNIEMMLDEGNLKTYSYHSYSTLLVVTSPIAVLSRQTLEKLLHCQLFQEVWTNILYLTLKVDFGTCSSKIIT